MRYTTVFFDMGGTLALRRPTSTEILGRFLQERGLDREPRTLLRASLSALDYHSRRTDTIPMSERTGDFWRTLYRESHAQALRTLDLPGDVESLLDEFLATLRLTPRHNAVYEDVVPTLRQLRDRGIKLAIVSNWNHSLVERCEELNLCEYFAAIVSSYTVGAEKPDPAIFRAALEQVGSEPAETLHVGDLVPKDVRGAQAAGITPVLVDRDDLHPDGDYVRITRLNEIVNILEGER